MRVSYLGQLYYIDDGKLKSKAPVLATALQSADCKHGVIVMESLCPVGRHQNGLSALLMYCANGTLPPPQQLAEIAEEFRFWGAAQCHPQLKPLESAVSVKEMIRYFLRTLFNSDNISNGYIALVADVENDEDIDLSMCLTQHSEMLRTMAFTECGLQLSISTMDEHLKERTLMNTTKTDVDTHKIKQRMVACVTAAYSDTELVLADITMSVRLQITTCEYEWRSIDMKITGDAAQIHRYSIVMYNVGEFEAHEIVSFLNEPTVKNHALMIEGPDDKMPHISNHCCDYFRNEEGIEEVVYVLLKDCHKFNQEVFSACSHHKRQLYWSRVL